MLDRVLNTSLIVTNFHRKSIAFAHAGTCFFFIPLLISKNTKGPRIVENMMSSFSPKKCDREMITSTLLVHFFIFEIIVKNNEIILS